MALRMILIVVLALVLTGVASGTTVRPSTARHDVVSIVAEPPPRIVLGRSITWWRDPAPSAVARASLALQGGAIDSQWFAAARRTSATVYAPSRTLGMPLAHLNCVTCTHTYGRFWISAYYGKRLLDENAKDRRTMIIIENSEGPYTDGTQGDRLVRTLIISGNPTEVWTRCRSPLSRCRSFLIFHRRGAGTWLSIATDGLSPKASLTIVRSVRVVPSR